MSEEQIVHLNLPGQSGRVVKFRVLDMNEVDSIEANAARGAGESATFNDLRREYLKALVPAFIVAYTEPKHPALTTPKLRDGVKPEEAKPGDYLELVDPEKVKAIAWKGVSDPKALELSWASIFTPKDTRVLRWHYINLHEIGGDEVEMLSGKAIPAPTGE